MMIKNKMMRTKMNQISSYISLSLGVTVTKDRKFTILVLLTQILIFAHIYNFLVTQNSLLKKY